MNKERHMFPGGNTPSGFFSYYPYIMPQNQANHIFCLKGGPGVGKSTFMKRIGREMAEKGHSIEYMHCSSDPGSLDGLVLADMKIALIDGTAPHVVDPKNPGAVDEIVNLGECWLISGIKQHREDIMHANSAVGKLFARVYRYLGAAKKIYDDLDIAYTEYTDDTAVDVELAQVSNYFSEFPMGLKLGSERKLFASAITPDGLIHYLNSIFGGCQNVFEIKGAGKAPTAFLRSMAAEATHRGLDTEQYYCPIVPEDKIEHLLIPELSLAFTTSNSHHSISGFDTKTIDFNKYIDKKALQEHSTAIEYDSMQFEQLINEAVATLHKAKAMHDYMETFYIPYMDFDAVSTKREEIAERILAL